MCDQGGPQRVATHAWLLQLCGGVVFSCFPLAPDVYAHNVVGDDSACPTAEEVCRSNPCAGGDRKTTCQASDWDGDGCFFARCVCPERGARPASHCPSGWRSTIYYSDTYCAWREICAPPPGVLPNCNSVGDPCADLAIFTMGCEGPGMPSRESLAAIGYCCVESPGIPLQSVCGMCPSVAVTIGPCDVANQPLPTPGTTDDPNQGGGDPGAEVPPGPQEPAETPVHVPLPPSLPTLPIGSTPPPPPTYPAGATPGEPTVSPPGTQTPVVPVVTPPTSGAPTKPPGPPPSEPPLPPGPPPPGQPPPLPPPGPPTPGEPPQPPGPPPGEPPPYDPPPGEPPTVPPRDPPPLEPPPKEPPPGRPGEPPTVTPGEPPQVPPKEPPPPGTPAPPGPPGVVGDIRLIS
jgi:hypothetical protein